MNDNDLKQLFEKMDSSPEDSTREKAVEAALVAFDQTQAAAGKKPEDGQGKADVHRLTPETHTAGRKTMKTNSPPQRWLYSGVASAAMLVIGLLIAQQVPQHSGFQIPSPATQSTTPHAEPNAATIERRFDLSTAPTDKEISIAGAVVADTKPPSDPRPMLESRNIAEDDSIIANAALRPPVEIAMNRPALADARRQEVARARAAPKPKYLALEEKVVTAQKRMGTAGLTSLQSSIVSDQPDPTHYQDVGRDRFQSTDTNLVKRVMSEPVSTFSIDVDTSSYSFVRRELNRGLLPQKAAVRLEEMVNYFPYDYPLPDERIAPFSTNITVIDTPWNTGNKLVRIGIQGYELQAERPRTNLVLLLDVSGSMNNPNKLPLVKQSMGLLLESLQPDDTVAIVVYAGAAGTVLEPTPVREKQKILAALNRLQAGGSTAGAAGIQLAYQLAQANFVKEGVNRIILATDGDFNVGISDREELKGFVERKRKSGVYLSVLGFGQCNFHDALMQDLAQNGNGTAAYIDTLGEAQKVLVDEATSTLFTIAGDVKIQVEFNKATVNEYRLLGYETRILAEEDFSNDAVDAGDIGAGHSVTALYEITPAGSDNSMFSNSRYAEPDVKNGKADEYGFVQLRYKLPGEDQSRLISQPILVTQSKDASALREAHFASAVAGLAQLLQGGKYTGSWGYQDALQLALENRGEDRYGYRSELVQLIRKAEIADAM